MITAARVRCAVGVVAVSASAALAQTGSGAPPAFNTIRTPSSPAFTLLGISPTAVERPNTLADFALALARSVKDFDTVPQNFSIEASPYWLTGHPELEWRDEIERAIGKSLVRTFSVSAATAETGKKDVPVTSLAVGARTSLLSGRLRDSTVMQIERLENDLQLLAKVYLLELNRRAADADMQLMRKLAAAKTDEERNAALAEHKATMDVIATALTNSRDYRESPEYKRVSKAVDNFVAAREGLMVEVAAAGRWAFADAEWSNRNFNRWSVWATPSYLASRWSLVGVARYIADDLQTATTFDWGARAILSRDRYAWSVEFVRRVFPDADGVEAQYRFVGIAEYQVWAASWVTASFGRDHNSSEKGGLVAQLGLSFNFAEERFLKP